MNDNNKGHYQPLASGDVKAIRNNHAELHALLVFICHDDFRSFVQLSGEQQKNLLNLAHSASQSLADCLE